MDYGLILLGAFLASAHCVGMCGCFAVLAGSGERTTWGRLRAQTVYSSGRLFTYAFLGVMAGWAGTVLTGTAWGATFSNALSLASGVLFVVIGLEILGLWKLLGGFGRTASRWFTLGLGPLIHQFSGRGGTAGTFVTGVLTGFLPCGLVYAFALKAASTASPGAGLLTMVAFGVGTVPAMMATGLVGGLLTARRRAYVYRFAGVILLVLGSITIWRGRPIWADQPEQVPACHAPSTSVEADSTSPREQAP